MKRNLNCLIKYLIICAVFFAAAVSVFSEDIPKKDETRKFKRVSKFGIKVHKPEKKYVILWCDSLLNYETLFTRPGICRMLDKCAKNKIDAVAVPAKTHLGWATYNSLWTKRMNCFPGSDVKTAADFDMLKIFEEEAHKRDIDVLAVSTLFTGGDKKYKTGLYYEGNKEEISVINDIPYGTDKTNSELRSILDIDGSKYDLSGGIVFGNPIDPNVQQREINILTEIAVKYNVDGIMLDKMRYSGIHGDFSPLSRKQFEGYIARKVENFPDDILKIKMDSPNSEAKVVFGPLFKEWCKWRALNMKDFMDVVKNRIKAVKPELPIGINAASWYPEYYETGVNWASELYIPGTIDKNRIRLYDWAGEWFSERYQVTGISGSLNFISAGCYYDKIKLSETTGTDTPSWRTVEGGCDMVKNVTKGMTPVFAGISAKAFADDKVKFRDAIKTALEKSDGVQLYDLSAIEQNNLWSDIAEAVEVKK